MATTRAEETPDAAKAIKSRQVGDSTLTWAAEQALNKGRISEADYELVIERKMRLDEAVRRVRDGEQESAIHALRIEQVREAAQRREEQAGFAAAPGREDEVTSTAPNAPYPKEIDATENEPVGVLLSDVVAEGVKWLWKGRVPKGKLTLLDGDPAKGKSVLTIHVAACVTEGRAFPDGAPCEAAGVVLLNTEDGLADTILPRLEAAGGDPSKVLSLATVPAKDGYDRLLSIPDDIDIIERGIRQVNADLVVIDPFMAFLNGKLNAHKDQDVRKALAPLAAMAERTGAAVVIVRHLNKAEGGSALYRGGGSIGIIGQARSALLVAEDPEDDRRRVLAPLKSNLSQPAPSLVFTVASAHSGAARVEWMGETKLKADRLLSAPAGPGKRSAQAEAEAFLREALADGPKEATVVMREAEEADIAKATLQRAKKALNVRSDKKGDGPWFWTLPEDTDREGQQESLAPEDEPLEHLECLPVPDPLPRGEGEQGAQGVQGIHVGTDERVAPAEDWLEHPLDCGCVECL